MRVKLPQIRWQWILGLSGCVLVALISVIVIDSLKVSLQAQKARDDAVNQSVLNGQKIVQLEDQVKTEDQHAQLLTARINALLAAILTLESQVRSLGGEPVVGPPLGLSFPIPGPSDPKATSPPKPATRSKTTTTTPTPPPTTTTTTTTRPCHLRLITGICVVN